MFKRIFDFFKRDKAKREVVPIITHMEAPKPGKPRKAKQPWITRLVQFNKARKLRAFVLAGDHIANVRHITKPLKMKFQRTDFSASADVHIDRLKGTVPPRKQERFEIGLGSRKFKVTQ